jgi:hypothetical protein
MEFVWRVDQIRSQAQTLNSTATINTRYRYREQNCNKVHKSRVVEEANQITESCEIVEESEAGSL